MSSFNAKKLWRKIAQEHYTGEAIGPRDAMTIRRLIGQSLVRFMTALGTPTRLTVTTEEFDADTLAMARHVEDGDVVVVVDEETGASMTIVSD